MNYKLKSLLFFIAFLLSAVIYYTIDQQSIQELHNPKTEITEMESDEDIPAREDHTVSFIE